MTNRIQLTLPKESIIRKVKVNETVPKRILVIFFLFLNIFLLVITNIFADNWTIKTIDYSDYKKYSDFFDNFYSSAIAVDSNGRPHIAYGGNHLYYAYYDGSIWRYETIDSSSKVGQYASIAIDKSGKAHISYYDDHNHALKYATNASGSWEIITVDDKNDRFIGRYTSIALDTSNNIHISYHYTTGEFWSGLKYANNTSNSWTITTIEELNGKPLVGDIFSIGDYTSIAVDASNNVHISYRYYYFEIGQLKYATNSNGSWVTTTVDNSGNVGMYTSIAIDSSDKTHITYYDSDNGDLKYTTNATGLWVTTTVDSSGDVGQYTSITLDTSGNVHISYYDATNKFLKYANNTSGTWTTTTIDNNGDVGKYSSITLDSSDKVHITYIHSLPTNDRYYGSKYINKGIKYATNTDTISTSCEAKSLNISPKTLVLTVGNINNVIVNVKGEDNCSFGGITVNAKIGKNKRNLNIISETSIDTAESGNAIFTLRAVKVGIAKVTFSVGNLRKEITVKIKQ